MIYLIILKINILKKYFNVLCFIIIKIKYHLKKDLDSCQPSNVASYLVSCNLTVCSLVYVSIYKMSILKYFQKSLPPEQTGIGERAALPLVIIYLFIYFFR